MPPEGAKYILKALKLADRVIARIEGWMIVLFLSLMVIFTFFQVCLRGLYTHGHLHWANTLMGHLDWSEPFVRLLVLWLTFLGASLLTGENKHIKIDLFATILSPRWLLVREFIISVACVFISSVMVKVSIDYINIEIEFGGRIFLGLPGWLGQMIIPAGFALIMFRFIVRAIDQALQIAWGVEK